MSVRDEGESNFYAPKITLYVTFRHVMLDLYAVYRHNE